MLMGFAHEEGADILLHISSSSPFTSPTFHTIFEECLHKICSSLRMNAEGDLLFFS